MNLLFFPFNQRFQVAKNGRMTVYHPAPACIEIRQFPAELAKFQFMYGQLKGLCPIWPLLLGHLYKEFGGIHCCPLLFVSWKSLVLVFPGSRTWNKYADQNVWLKFDFPKLYAWCGSVTYKVLQPGNAYCNGQQWWCTYSPQYSFQFCIFLEVLRLYCSGLWQVGLTW